MALSDIVSVVVSLSSAQVTRQGFGVPLILAYDAPVGFAARTTRSYTSDAGLAADFPGADSPTAKAAAKIFAQNPCPPLVKVGIGSLPPTQVFTVTPQGPFTTGTVYSFTFDGQLVTFTMGATQTLAACCTGLAAAGEALTLSPDASFDGSSGTHVAITAVAAGDFHALEITPAQSLTMSGAQTQADPGVA